jgi:hypothetical protein
MITAEDLYPIEGAASLHQLLANCSTPHDMGPWKIWEAPCNKDLEEKYESPHKIEGTPHDLSCGRQSVRPIAPRHVVRRRRL